MKEPEIISATESFVKSELEGGEAGHDWWHIDRVRKSALHLARQEGANLFIVELGALLHDIGDSKFHDGDENLGPRKVKTFLESLNLETNSIEHLIQIVENISFTKSLESSNFRSLELNVIQDADRLDAIGAIGIARAFSFGGYKKRIFYDPEIPPIKNISKEEYKKRSSPTINHFYEKLLLLKDMMNTQAGQRMAQERHQFMELYLEQFYSEWRGEK